MESVDTQIGRLKTYIEVHEEHISNLRKGQHDLANNFTGTNLIIARSSKDIEKLLDMYIGISDRVSEVHSSMKDDLNNSSKELREQMYSLQSKSQEEIIKKNIVINFIGFLSRNWYKLSIFFGFIYLIVNGHNIKDLLMEFAKT